MPVLLSKLDLRCSACNSEDARAIALRGLTSSASYVDSEGERLGIVADRDVADAGSTAGSVRML